MLKTSQTCFPQAHALGVREEMGQNAQVLTTFLPGRGGKPFKIISIDLK